jgi:purine-binding chemotaxis protein CheW
MRSGETTERSAIVVVEVSGADGTGVDQVTDMLSVTAHQLQPTPDIVGSFDRSCCEGIITHVSGMICCLNLNYMFPHADEQAA